MVAKKINIGSAGNTFPVRLRIVMRNKEWQQKAVAQIAGVTEQTVSRWFRKNIKPNDAPIDKIAKASGCNFYWLRDDDYDGPQMESARWGYEANKKTFTNRELSGLYYRIEEILTANGIGKEQMAARAGLTCQINVDSHYWIGTDEGVPSPWDIEKISENYGYNKEWIWYGRGARRTKEIPPTAYPIQLNGEANPKLNDYLGKTTRIITSKTIYRSALERNIDAFHKAVEMEDEMQGVKEDLRQMRDEHRAEMEELKEMIRSLGGCATEKKQVAN